NAGRLVFVVSALSVQTIDQLTWSNVRVQPSAATPLAAGPITLDASSTAPFTGVGPGSSVGELTEVNAYPVRTLASFNGSVGSGPQGSLVQDSQGDLFGTTELGGTFNQGTVFEIAAGSNVITTLASFDGTNGAHPTGSLAIDSQGNLFGTNGQNAVFELAAGSGAITILASLPDDTQGGDN